mgnify:CR=1 FL=1
MVKRTTIDDLAIMIKNSSDSIEERLTTIETSMATKEDLKSFATKDDLKAFATKDDLNQLKKELTITIHNEVSRLDSRIDQSALYSGLTNLTKRVRKLEKQVS